MRVISPKFEIGDIVYLKIDKEQLPRIVYCYKVYIDNILYDLASGVTTPTHYKFELSREQNILLLLFKKYPAKICRVFFYKFLIFGL